MQDYDLTSDERITLRLLQAQRAAGRFAVDRSTKFVGTQFVLNCTIDNALERAVLIDTTASYGNTYRVNL